MDKKKNCFNSSLQKKKNACRIVKITFKNYFARRGFVKKFLV